MSVEVTIRHMDSSDAIQNMAKERAASLQADFAEIEFVRIVIDQDGPNYQTDVTVQGGRKMNAKGAEKLTDLIASLNGAFDKVRTQLRKQTEKRQETR